MAPTVIELLKQCESRLLGVDSPRLSAEVLVAEALGCSRLSLVIDRDRSVSSEEAERVECLVARREKGEPVAYILGSKEFYGLDFMVTPDTLIPRPETEHLIDQVEALYPNDADIRFADLGTGSGILAVTLATVFPGICGVAVDMSSGALKVARENAKVHSVSERLSFIQGDFTNHLFLQDSLDLIVSNPPYVTETEYLEASSEVTDFEPKTALVSGVDGLDHIKAMLPYVANALRPGGRFLMEIGYAQGKDVVRIVTEKFPEYETVEIMKDLAGHDRIVSLIIK